MKIASKIKENLVFLKVHYFEECFRETLGLTYHDLQKRMSFAKFLLDLRKTSLSGVVVVVWWLCGVVWWWSFSHCNTYPG